MADVSSVNLPRGAASFARYEQTFPTLTPHEIDRMRRFGEVRRFSHGEALFETGKPGPGMFVMLSGNVVISHRDGLGHVAHIIDQGPGQFMAEIGQLSGRVALVDGHADGEVETLLIAPDNLRALLVAEADLGERIMRALILRRVRLIQEGVGGAVLIGSEALGDMARLQNFLARNGQPHHLLDPASDTDAADLVARYAAARADLPLVVCPDGTVLKNPSETDLAYALGMIGIHAHDKLYDVAVVGGGPAGLSTAVYAASEGLSVAVLDARAYGGQAGASMRIENYLGFPTGISGQALAGRAFTQAQKFGAEIWIPVTAKSLDCAYGDGLFALETECGQLLRAHLAIVAEQLDVATVWMREWRYLEGERREEFVAARRRYEERIRGLFQEGVELSELRADLDVTAAALLFLSAANWAYTWLKPGRDTDELADRFFALLVDGMRGYSTPA
jgi:thioredoxin reductase (NADPH)